MAAVVLVLGLADAILFFTSIGLMVRAAADARPHLRREALDDRTAQYFWIDTEFVPADVRRRYRLSRNLMSVCFPIAAVVCWAAGQVAGAALLSLMTLAMLYTPVAQLWQKYQGRANASIARGEDRAKHF